MNAPADPMLKLARDTHHCRAWADALGFASFADVPAGKRLLKNLTIEESRAISKRQAEYRRILGIEPPGRPEDGWRDKLRIEKPPEVGNADADGALFG